jgi:hypothetical protein
MNTEMNMDKINTEKNIEPKEPHPPTPIFLASPINYIELCKNLKQITKNEGFICKSTAKNIKINLQSSNSYRTIIKLFHENNLEYHIYQTREEKFYEVVMKNLHHSIPTNFIKEEIKNHGFLVKILLKY